jgi:cytochrome c oxidase subunit II
MIRRLPADFGRSVDTLPTVVDSDHFFTSRRRRFALAFVAAVATALLLAPVASADFLLPESGGSPNADQISDLYTWVLAVAVIVFVGVEGAIIWCIVRYRRKKNPVADQIHGNTNLEIGWTVGAALILVVLAGITFALLPGIRNPPNSSASGLSLSSPQYAIGPDSGKQPPDGRSLNIQVNGQQYVWRFTYPDRTPANTLDNVFQYEQMVVPTGTTVTLNIRAQDVAHSWWIPQLGGKFDAIPGYTNHTWFKISKPGVYSGQCAELCGRNHANMVASVRAVSPNQYRAWYAVKARQIKTANIDAAKERPTIGTPKSEAVPAAAVKVATAKPAPVDAKKLFVSGKGQATACGSCHTLAAAGTNSKVGPDLNKFIEKDDDVAAIKEMILSPNKEIAKGFSAGIMPQIYGTTLTPADVDALATYIFKNTR